MRLSPDELNFLAVRFYQTQRHDYVHMGLMLIMIVSSKIITSKLSSGLNRSIWQNFLEIIVTTILTQIEQVGLSRPRKYLGFLHIIPVHRCGQLMHYYPRL